MAKNLATVQMVNSVGAVNRTTLYDLKVFNYLAMRLDTDLAWEKNLIIKENSSLSSHGLKPRGFSRSFLDKHNRGALTAPLFCIHHHLGKQMDGSRKVETVTFRGLAPRRYDSISSIRCSVSAFNSFSFDMS